MLAYELLPPLMMCCSRVEASIVLCEVLAQTYGRGKLATAKIEPAKIAERSGRKRPNIWRGVKELTDAEIIKRLPDGTYRFQKDYSKWRSDKELLVDKPLAQYFAAFPHLSKSYREECQPEVTVSTLDTASTIPNGKPDPPSVSTLDTVSVSTLDTVHPIREIGEGVGVVTSVRVPSKTVSVSEAESEASASIQSLKPGFPLQPDPAEVDRLAKWAGGFGKGLEELGSKVHDFSTSYPLDWIRKAILCGASKAGPGRMWAYAHGCLRRWEVKGSPDDAEVKAAERSAPRPSGPSPESPDRAAAELASKGCPHCGGKTGLADVWHSAPDPRRRIAATGSATCVCELGRWVKAHNASRPLPDFADVLEGRGPWLAAPPTMSEPSLSQP